VIVAPRRSSTSNVSQWMLLERTSLSCAQSMKDAPREGFIGFSHIDSDDIGRTLGVISMRALGIRSSYKGRTVDA
jgi:hypothetical protein